MASSPLRVVRLALTVVCSVACGVVCIAPTASAQEPFYKGKRVTVMINFAPGGPTDIEGRLFARYVARHIEGGPNIVAQNMDGAAGLVGTNWLGEVAPRDGTAIGYITGGGWQYVNAPSRFRVDLRSYEFIAYQPGTTVYYVRTDVPGVRVAADLVKAKGLISGGLSADSSKDMVMRLGLDMLGVPFRHVTGYRSNNNARMALQQNEINFFSESPPAYRSVVEPSLVKDGIVMPTWYDSGWNGEAIVVPRQVEGLAIPPFHEFYRAVHGKEPSGQFWEVYLSNLAINATMQRLVMMPPGAPAAAVEALRTAVNRLNSDKDFAEEAIKAMGFAPEFIATPQTNRQVRQALVVKPEIRAFVANYIKSANR